MTTRRDSESSGPRSHVTGVITAFQALGFDVHTFIVGDRISPRLAHQSESVLHRSRVHALAADLARLSMGVLNSRIAWRELGRRVDWVYERLGSFQALGRVFQQHGALWVLESNALLFREAKVERQTSVLSGLARRFEFQAYRDCDVLVCISEMLKEMICREADIPSEKILVVPNGVNTSFFDPARHSQRRLFDGFTVGFVGRLNSWQALDVVLHAIWELRKEKGLAINLAVVGDGVMKGEWTSLVRQLGLADVVRFTGQVSSDDVPSYIAGFDLGYSGQVALKTSGMYLSPLKTYEYMAMAKPVLAADFADSRRLVQASGAGFLFVPGQKDDLKRALSDAYSYRGKLPAMGWQGRAEIISHHSWKSRVSEIISGIHSLLEARNAAI